MSKTINIRVWKQCSEYQNSNHPGDRYHSYSSSPCSADECRKGCTNSSERSFKCWIRWMHHWDWDRIRFWSIKAKFTKLEIGFLSSD